MANNTQYHQANSSISGWQKLSTNMKARYFVWKQTADSSWSGKYKVIVSYNAGRRRFGGVKVATNTYQFETMADAQECQQWWIEYSRTIRNVATTMEVI